MNKAIKTIVLASFFLTLVGCSSDDTSKEPEGPAFVNKQLISHVKSTYYWYDEDGNTQHMSGKDYEIDFNFSYDDHLALSALTYKVTHYKEDEVLEVTDGVFNFKLNQARQLETLDITGDIMFRNTYTYIYTDGLVRKVESTDGSQKSEQTFTYNTAKQMIKSEIPSIPWTFNYTYNNKNQIIKVQSNRAELPEQIEYDTKNNPFKDLPFDMTTILFEGMDYMPLTYTFPNNIKEYKTPYLDTYLLEYKYDENNNPIKTSIYYQSDNQPKELDYEIDYSYITKKIEVTK
ncbi:hypothetical protein [Myroides sp. DW712]|uniref:hypothetical protein n=1 Tax=Myroides sp. DW712 TaxID=3389800 RepID=UPI00397AA1E8